MYDEILDEVEELAGRVPRAELAALLEERGRCLPRGAPDRAAWLTVAGEAWQMAGDPERARECYESAVDDGGGAYLDPRAELVGVLLDLGDTPRADALLADLESDTSGHRGGFVHATVGETLEARGRLEESLRWFDAGLADSERRDSADVDIACLNGHFRVRRTLGLPEDEHDRIAAERRRYLEADLADDEALGGPTAGSGTSLMTVLYWPPAELARLIERWPSFADDYGTDPAGHRSLVERHLRGLGNLGADVAVGIGTFDDYLEFAATRGEHAADASTRAAYAAHLGHLGRATPWPPGRNDRCWCGSGLKYPRCCGALRFDQQT